MTARGLATARGSRMRLSAMHFWVGGAVLLVLVFVSVMVFSPVDTQLVVLPSYEKAFGLQGGPLTVRDYRGETSRLYGLAVVDPGGPLGLAGFHAGDVPVAHHGGADALAWALRRSECGEATEISVVQASAWAERPLRRLTVPARRRPGARGCVGEERALEQ